MLKLFLSQANITRGVIAAFVVVAIFLGYALLDRFSNSSINTIQKPNLSKNFFLLIQ